MVLVRCRRVVDVAAAERRTRDTTEAVNLNTDAAIRLKMLPMEAWAQRGVGLGMQGAG